MYLNQKIKNYRTLKKNIKIELSLLTEVNRSGQFADHSSLASNTETQIKINKKDLNPKKVDGWTGIRCCLKNQRRQWEVVDIQSLQNRIPKNRN